MPNDENEQDRLDLLHHMVMLVTNSKHFFAPLKNEEVKRVLDVGTGTGIWAIEVADKHPEAEVLGNDLSPVQPSWVVRMRNKVFEIIWLTVGSLQMSSSRSMMSRRHGHMQSLSISSSPANWTVQFLTGLLSLRTCTSARDRAAGLSESVPQIYTSYWS